MNLGKARIIGYSWSATFRSEGILKNSFVFLSFLLIGTLATAASLSLDQGPLVLGRNDSVGVTLRLEERSGTADRPLRLSVNVGSFGGVNRIGPGVYRTVYTLPTTRFPQVALVAAWRETGPDAPIDFLRIPLYGTTKINVSGRPRSEVNVQIGTDEFGPTVTNARGEAIVPVVVPPNVPEAMIAVKDRSGNLTRRKAAVAVPPYNRVTLALVPHALLANGEDWSRVEVFYDVTGANIPAQKVRLVPNIGKVQLISAEGGRYVYKYTAPAGSTAKSARFVVAVEGDPMARGSAEVELGLPPPATLVVKAPEKSIVADGHSAAMVVVSVFDASGLGLPQQGIELKANEQLLTGADYLGNGTYQFRLVAPRVYPTSGLVQLSARLVRAQGEPLRAVANYQLLPPAIPHAIVGEVTPNPVIADGKSKAILTLDVRDSAGLPLKGAQLILVATQGTVGQVTELGNGRYQADYRAPENVPPDGQARIRIVDSSGAFETFVDVPLLQARRFLLGVKGEYVLGLGSMRGPRGGLDAWIPFRISDVPFGLGVSAVYGQARQTVLDPTGALQSNSVARFIPVTARVGYELFATRHWGVWIGVGGIATWAKVSSSINQFQSVKVGFGGMGFLGATLNAGPGQFVLDLAYAYAPVASTDFRLDAGGPGVSLGYRFGVF